MPYYRRPRFQTPTANPDTADSLHIQGLLTDIVMSTGWGQTYLSNVPAQFGEMMSSVHAASHSRTLLNSEVVWYAHQAMHFNWAVYSFSNGHFSSSIESRGLPFTICLVCNTTKSGHSLFHEFANNAAVFNSGHDLLNHIRASGDQSVIHGCLINSYHFSTSAITLSFWKLQLSIVVQLCLIWSLSIVVAIIIHDHDGRAVKSFVKGLGAARWRVSLWAVSYLEIGDSIAGSCMIITAVHSSCTLILLF
jgi:hypothetical protein